MKLEPGEPLHVVLAYGPNDTVPVGRLALDARQAVFGYDEAFIASGRHLAPGWPTPDRSVVRPKNPRAFQGLHGAFASNTDAWGQKIMRRRAQRAKLDYDVLGPRSARARRAFRRRRTDLPARLLGSGGRQH